MNTFVENLGSLYFIIFCIFIGIEIITNVPAILHTPLMSGTNAISGVITIGAITMLLKVDSADFINLTIGGVAVFLGALNISGGFYVTNRMLVMFNPKKK